MGMAAHVMLALISSTPVDAAAASPMASSVCLNWHVMLEYMYNIATVMFFLATMNHAVLYMQKNRLFKC